MLALAGAENGGNAAGLVAVALGFNAVVVCVAIGGLIIIGAPGGYGYGYGIPGKRNGGFGFGGGGSEAAVLAAAGWGAWP